MRRVRSAADVRAAVASRCIANRTGLCGFSLISAYRGSRRARGKTSRTPADRKCFHSRVHYTNRTNRPGKFYPRNSARRNYLRADLYGAVGSAILSRRCAMLRNVFPAERGLIPAQV